MPLDATDPRPRNPFGQFASGTSVTPDQMNRAYGIRTRVLASLLRTRPAMQNIPPLSSKDIARISGLAAKARGLTELARGDYAIPAMLRAKLIPYVSRDPKFYRKPMHGILVETALNRTGPKGIQLRRERVAKLLRAARVEAASPAASALSALAEREVELAARIGNLIGFGCGGKRSAKELIARVLSTPVELTRGDYILPYLARSGKLEIRPMVGRAKLNMVNGYVSRTGVDIAAQAKNLANITAAAISRPKDYKRILNAELYAKPGHHTWIRGELARGFWNERAARTALSALSDRTVELAASVAGEKIRRPQFVEEDGVVKIVKTDGTAAEIGRAPGFANLLRRNKGKLVVGGLGAAAGAVLAKKLLGKSKPAA